MTIVVGTAGHIDHGKTTLLRALTGIDADRLPEERRRGMTIDVGYAHLTLDDGTVVDFVDVPGHDRLVGNMLVGAGEIDAALLVVAADDGPRAQTAEHLAILDALAIRAGIVVITKTDMVAPGRVDEVRAAIEDRIARTTLGGSPTIAVSSLTGEGLGSLRQSLAELRQRVPAPAPRPPRLAVDRAFSIKGRGLVVTGTLRGGSLRAGDVLRVVPGGGTARVREVQVHGQPVERAEPGGRTALNLALGDGSVRRGTVLTMDPAVIASDRALVALTSPLPDRARRRLHVGTDATGVAVGRSGRDAIDLPDGRAAAIVRLEAAVALNVGDRFVLRRTDPPELVGGVVLDPGPARGVSRRRQTPQRVATLALAVSGGDVRSVEAARLELHGLLAGARPSIAPDVAEAAAAAALAAVQRDQASDLGRGSMPRARAAAVRAIRGSVTADVALAARAAADALDDLTNGGDLVRDGDVLRTPDHEPPAPDAERIAAMDRLEELLAVVAPPPLREAAAATGCPPDALRELERVGRIVILEPDLAYAMATYRDLAATALRLAAQSPLTPATLRDATGTSRRYVMPILEDLDRRGILRRTPDGHVPGPRAPAPVGRP